MSERGALVLSTASSPEEARRLARSLVEEELAACVNVVPGATSVYRWQGEVHEDPELLLILKTTPAKREALIARLTELHSYDCPEAIALPIVAGSEGYLSWLEEMVGGGA